MASGKGSAAGGRQRHPISSRECSSVLNAGDRSRLFPAAAENERIHATVARCTRRGDSVCKNALLIRRLDLERQLLAGLQARVLHPAVVENTLNRFEEPDAQRRTKDDLLEVRHAWMARHRQRWRRQPEPPAGQQPSPDAHFHSGDQPAEVPSHLASFRRYRRM